jgi:hypothetical protein
MFMLFYMCARRDCHRIYGKKNPHSAEQFYGKQYSFHHYIFMRTLAGFPTARQRKQARRALISAAPPGQTFPFFCPSALLSFR